MLEANDMVEAKLAEIRERKMYEAAGGMTKAEMEAKRKAGYRKASDVLGDPIKTQLSAATKKYREGKETEKKSEKKSWFPKINMSKERKIGEEAIDEAGLGYGAKIAHDPYMSPAKKKLFMAVRQFDKKSRLAKGKAAETEAPSNAPKITPPEANKNMKAAYSEPKGSKVGKAARFVAGGVAGGVGRAVRSIVSDLGDIGTSRL